MPFSYNIQRCCHDDLSFVMMSDEKVGLFENDYKSCFARSMVLNSQYNSQQQNKPQEVFGNRPLKMTVEHGSGTNRGIVIPSEQGISQGAEGFCSVERTISNVSKHVFLLIFIVRVPIIISNLRRN